MSRRINTPIGIDLGTTYSCVAAWFDQHNRVEVFPNEQGCKVTPSFVASTDHQELLVGESAKNQVTRNPTNTVYDVKRLMGRRFSDTILQEDLQSLPFKVIQGTNDKPVIVLEHMGINKEFSPEEISSMILRNLKKAAEAYLGTTVTDAVITVPAYFNDMKRKATKDAGALAGLNVMRLINEPTAAAIAYGLDKILDPNHPPHKNVFIFDLGGGTFDVSLLTITRDGTISVKAVCGDAHLGGEDFDRALVDYCVQEVMKRHKKDISKNAKAMGRLKVACEKEKRELSSTFEASVDIDCLYDGMDFFMKVTRARFEELNAHFFKKCIKHVEKCLRDGNIQKINVDDVVLVGGSTRIPKVKQMLGNFSSRKQIHESINADEAVAYGAALLAANLSGHGNKAVKDLVLEDVTPFSLGTSVIGGYMSVIIPRNTPIPTMKWSTYLTIEDNQARFAVDVYQGEFEKVEDNIFLDKFTLYGVPPAPAEKEKMKICFSMDANGILDVSAELLSTGHKESMVIRNSSHVSKDDIDKMKNLFDMKSRSKR